MRFIYSFAMFIARVLIAGIFFWGSFSKLAFFETTSAYMASKGFTAIPLFLFGAALLEFLGALSLVLGFKTRLGATILLLFLIPTTAIFHDFWNLQGDDEQVLQIIMFLKNLAIMGGLISLICHGAGGFSIDSLRRKPKPIPPPPTPVHPIPPESRPM